MFLSRATTSGFAFMGLFFCFASRKKRIAGLAFGIIAGWIAGNGRSVILFDHATASITHSMAFCARSSDSDKIMS